MRNREMTGVQCRAARAALGWTQEELGSAAQIARSTIRRLEDGGQDTRPIYKNALQEVMEKAGMQFVNDGELLGVMWKNASEAAA